MTPAIAASVTSLLHSDKVVNNANDNSILSFLSFPIAGLLGNLIGAVTTPLRAILAGAITGATLGLVWWLILKSQMPLSIWCPLELRSKIQSTVDSRVVTVHSCLHKVNSKTGLNHMAQACFRIWRLLLIS